MIHGIFREQDRPFIERFGCVQELVQVHVQLAAQPVALRAHALRIVEREDVDRTDVRLADAREQAAQHAVNIGDRPHRRVRTAAEPLLVHDDRHAQVLDGVRIGLGIARQEVADEQAEVLVQQSLGFGGDGVEYDGRFAGAGYAGKDRDLAFGDAQRNILQVVLARAANLDVFLGHEFSPQFLFSIQRHSPCRRHR